VTAPVPRSEYPFWVKLSIWGVPGRGGVWACVGLSIAGAVAVTLYGLRDGRFLIGGPVLGLAAIPYWLSIRWIDRHGSWERRP
jgi:hypothetical protein